MSNLNNLINNLNNKNKKGRDYLFLYEQGDYIFRILPSIEGEDEAPFEEFTLHGGFVHPIYKQPSNYRCLKTKDCPMCLAAKQMKSSGDPNAWRFEAKQYFFYNVIDRKDGRLKLLKANWNAHSQLFAKILEAARAYQINLMSPENGRDVQITVRAVDSKMTYKAFILSERETKPVAGKVLQECLLLRPLHDQYRSYSREELQAIIDGKEPKNAVVKKKSVSKSKLIANLTASLTDDIKEEITKNSDIPDLFEED